MNDEREEEEQSERPRPRVVDKRVSARQAATTPSPPPEPRETPAPAPAGGGSGSPETGPPSAPGPTTPPSAPEPASDQGGPDEQVWTPEQEAQAQQIAKEIAERPSQDWVLNVAVTLANVAGAKLDMGLVEDARLAIDAFEALVNGVASKLEGAEAPLRQTLAQLQMAYAQSVTAAPPPTP